MPVRTTVAVEQILCLMLTEPDRAFYGLELSKATALKSGVLYPVLHRLEREGFVTSTWEDADPSEERRPTRRYYRLTAAGAAEAVRIRRDIRARMRVQIRGAQA